jgi:predicted enzyme related to lactoylglutathione lyase
VVELLVCIDVEDLERGIDFYSRGLGLAVGARRGPDWVELIGARVPVMLIANPAGSKPSTGAVAGRDYRRHWTPVHLDFVVADLTAAVARARAAGATQEGEIEVRAWNSIAYMADPWGNGFDLLQLPAG